MPKIRIVFFAFLPVTLRAPAGDSNWMKLFWNNSFISNTSRPCGGQQLYLFGEVLNENRNILRPCGGQQLRSVRHRLPTRGNTSRPCGGQQHQIGRFRIQFVRNTSRPCGGQQRTPDNAILCLSHRNNSRPCGGQQRCTA